MKQSHKYIHKIIKKMAKKKSKKIERKKARVPQDSVTITRNDTASLQDLVAVFGQLRIGDVTIAQLTLQL
jgi:hypothetical protein